MGNFYTNITLKGADTQAVLRVLRSARHKAYVSRDSGHGVVVYDEECEGQDEQVLRDLAAHLSLSLGVPSLAVLNHDDDILAYFLFNRLGRQIDSYNSAPNYFGGEPVPPSGGDAELLSGTFDQAAAVEKVRQILHEGGGAEFQKEREVLLVAAEKQKALFIRQFQGQPALLKQFEEAFDQKARGFAFEVERHEALVKALGLPDCAVGNGFNYLSQGEQGGEFDEGEFEQT